MFTQNARRPGRLTGEHHRNQYAILYYHFIRHAFGLIYSPKYETGVPFLARIGSLHSLRQRVSIPSTPILRPTALRRSGPPAPTVRNMMQSRKLLKN
jgi:hypothetical protein